MTALSYDVQTFSDVFIALVIFKGLITSAKTIPCRIRKVFLTLQSLYDTSAVNFACNTGWIQQVYLPEYMDIDYPLL